MSRRSTFRAALAGAAVLFLIGCLLPILPLFWRPQTGLGANLRDFGNVIAGSWAVTAGLLTVVGAYSVSEAERAQRQMEVAMACLAQIESFWSYLGQLKTLDELGECVRELELEVINIASVAPAHDDDEIRTFRGHVGHNWLSLQTASPDMLGALPADISRDTSSYFSRLLNVAGRLNWLNDHKAFRRHDLNSVLETHDLSYKQLKQLSEERISLTYELKRLAHPQ